jgi:hypothetical protein
LARLGSRRRRRRRRCSWSGGGRAGFCGRALCGLGGFLRLFFSGGFCFFGGGFCARKILKMFSDFFRSGNVYRAGMSLFLCDAGFRQIVNDGLGLDFKIAGQFIDADLIGV